MDEVHSIGIGNTITSSIIKYNEAVNVMSTVAFTTSDEVEDLYVLDVTQSDRSSFSQVDLTRITFDGASGPYIIKSARGRPTAAADGGFFVVVQDSLGKRFGMSVIATDRSINHKIEWSMGLSSTAMQHH